MLSPAQKKAAGIHTVLKSTKSLDCRIQIGGVHAGDEHRMS